MEHTMDLFALPDPEVAEISRVILEEKVLHRHPDGSLKETPKGMLWRVASHIAEAERFYPDSRYGGSMQDIETESRVQATAEQFYTMMARRQFLPNSPALVGAKTKRNGLAACFALYPDDNMESIFQTAKEMAIVHAAGGGTGFPMHLLRPAGAYVGGTRGGDTGGPLSFMEVYNAITDAVRQGGTRRGASIAILRVDHPDILEFIRCKRDLSAANRRLFEMIRRTTGIAPTSAEAHEIGQRLVETQFANFNISVGITDEFMKALADDGEIQLSFGGQCYRKIRARTIFDEIVDGAWRNGEPGAIFLDTINEKDPESGWNGRIETPNPCSEQPLHDGQACVLGSINLERFVLPGRVGSKAVQRLGSERAIDWFELGRVVQLGVRFLDNMIDMSRFPVEKIDQATKASRPIGLGVMGWHSLLMLLGIPYESNEALSLGRRLMTYIRERAVEESVRLAEERGACPIWPQTRWAKQGDRPRRHSRLTTVAPTGTISLIANCSPAIEPVFGLGYTKQIVDGPQIQVIEPAFEAFVREKFGGPRHDPELVPFLLSEAVRAGSVQHLVEWFDEDERAVLRNAREIAWEWHLAHQKIWQHAGIESGCAKTINLPYSAPRQTVANAIWQAWEARLTGITLYRDGSRQLQVIRNEPGGEDPVGAACSIDPATGAKTCA